MEAGLRSCRPVRVPGATAEGAESVGRESTNLELVVELGKTLDLDVGGRCVWWRVAEKNSGADISEFGVKTKAEKS